MVIPEKLKKGDKIGIISTARKISRNELKPAIVILESWGLKIELGKNLFNQDNQFSGTIEERVLDLQKMINDDTIKAIFCARGGYGTVHVIDKIDFTRLNKFPKWIIGYSDITILHSHLNSLGIATIHATMPINFSTNTVASISSLKKSVFGIPNSIECQNHPLNKEGDIEGEIIGGNLSILYSLLGSKSDVITDNKILFIEDLDEYLYHIERMIISLRRSGKFQNLKGLIVGGMKDMNDNEISFGKTAEQIIFDQTESFSFPICFNLPIGHLSENRSIILGVRSRLKIMKNQVVLEQ